MASLTFIEYLPVVRSWVISDCNSEGLLFSVLLIEVKLFPRADSAPSPFDIFADVGWSSLSFFDFANKSLRAEFYFTDGSVSKVLDGFSFFAIFALSMFFSSPFEGGDGGFWDFSKTFGGKFKAPLKVFWTCLASKIALKDLLPLKAVLSFLALSLISLRF